jgi:uncharacterized protein (TIGR02646 family)
MRTIQKRREPDSLTEYRRTPRADYENYRDKETLRVHLVQEQRGLCCYCLAPIRAELGGMKIEHWHCQANYAHEQLDYSNLLGACMGNDGRRVSDQHCDTRKGRRDLSRNPADPMHHVDDLVRFQGDGRILSNSPAFDAEINEVLNLNLPFLRNSRKAVLSAFQRGFAKRGHVSRAVLQEWLLDWNGESGPGTLRPFCQVVVYWIRKRLARP